jgi:hypothetical protein
MPNMVPTLEPDVYSAYDVDFTPIRMMKFSSDKTSAGGY